MSRGSTEDRARCALVFVLRDEFGYEAAEALAATAIEQLAPHLLTLRAAGVGVVEARTSPPG